MLFSSEMLTVPHFKFINFILTSCSLLTVGYFIVNSWKFNVYFCRLELEFSGVHFCELELSGVHFCDLELELSGFYFCDLETEFFSVN
jgi:hypothetical protein